MVFLISPSLVHHLFRSGKAGSPRNTRNFQKHQKGSISKIAVLWIWRIKVSDVLGDTFLRFTFLKEIKVLKNFLKLYFYSRTVAKKFSNFELKLLGRVAKITFHVSGRIFWLTFFSKEPNFFGLRVKMFSNFQRKVFGMVFQTAFYVSRENF